MPVRSHLVTPMQHALIYQNHPLLMLPDAPANVILASRAMARRARILMPVRVFRAILLRSAWILLDLRTLALAGNVTVSPDFLVMGSYVSVRMSTPRLNVGLWS